MNNYMILALEFISKYNITIDELEFEQKWKDLFEKETGTKFPYKEHSS